MDLTLHTDGGSRGNPGPSGIGFVLEHEGQIVCSGGAFIGTATNNVAEYEALIWGLENARALGATGIEMIADSELMVKQITGAYKIKNAALKILAARVHGLLKDFESWSFEHTLRAGNTEADALVNEALDTQGTAGGPAQDWTATPLSLFPGKD
ncbi:MAG: ribonuclease HI family protein [Actinomycetia bacterium]|nr:ribonuclease HI family protein [Actinomycetes bacterium]